MHMTPTSGAAEKPAFLLMGKQAFSSHRDLNHLRQRRMLHALFYICFVISAIFLCRN